MIENKICIVTGAGRGIGLKVVHDLLDMGNIVIACSKTKSKALEKISKEKDMSEILFEYTFDISDQEKSKEIIQSIWKKFRRIDILINCVGIPHGSLFLMTKIEDLKNIFNINYFSILYIIQLCSRLMSRNKKGVICNISSSSSFLSDPGTLVYGSSKAALNFSTKVLSKELSEYGIRINTVAPGVTKTDMLDMMDQLSIQKQLEQSSLKKIADPSQISSVIIFLCSDAASHITGQTVKVDGGL